MENVIFNVYEQETYMNNYGTGTLCACEGEDHSELGFEWKSCTPFESFSVEKNEVIL